MNMVGIVHPVTDSLQQQYIEGNRIRLGRQVRLEKRQIGNRVSYYVNGRPASKSRWCREHYRFRRLGARLSIPRECWARRKKKKRTKKVATPSGIPTQPADLERLRMELRKKYAPVILQEPKPVAEPADASGDSWLLGAILIAANAVIWSLVIYFWRKGGDDDPPALPPEAQRLREMARGFELQKSGRIGINLYHADQNLAYRLWDQNGIDSYEIGADMSEQQVVSLAYYWMQHELGMRMERANLPAMGASDLFLDVANEYHHQEMPRFVNSVDDLIGRVAHQVSRGHGLFTMEATLAHLAHFWEIKTHQSKGSEERWSRRQETAMRNVMHAIVAGDSNVALRNLDGVVDAMGKKNPDPHSELGMLQSLHYLGLAEMRYRMAATAEDDTTRRAHLSHAEKRAGFASTRFNEYNVKNLSDHRIASLRVYAQRLDEYCANAMRARGSGVALRPVGMVIPGYGPTAAAATPGRILPLTPLVRR